jgi:hypothetical protein
VAWCSLGQGSVVHISGNPEGEGADWNPSRTCIRTAISKLSTLVPIQSSLQLGTTRPPLPTIRLALAVRVEFQCQCCRTLCRTKQAGHRKCNSVVANKLTARGGHAISTAPIGVHQKAQP